MSEAQNPIYKHLHDIKIKDIIRSDQKENGVATLKDTTSIELAVKKFSENKILSCPVFQEETKEMIGFVDVLDVLKYIVSASPQQSELDRDQDGVLEIAGRAIGLVPVSKCVDLSKKDPMLQVFEDAPVTMVTQFFSLGYHRAVVFDGDDVKAVVSQSDVNSYLAQYIERGSMKHIGEKTISSLGYGVQKVESVNESTTVLDCIKSMTSSGVGQVPVVNGEGVIIGNFSASDLRGLYSDYKPKFLTSVVDFLKEKSPKSLQPVTVTKDNTLTDCIKLMAEKRLHHLWVVDGDKKPTSLLSLTDVMKIAMSPGLVH